MKSGRRSRRRKPTRAVIPGAAERRLRDSMLLRVDDHWRTPGLVYRMWPDGSLREILDPVTRRPV